MADSQLMYRNAAIFLFGDDAVQYPFSMMKVYVRYRDMSNDKGAHNNISA